MNAMWCKPGVPCMVPEGCASVCARAYGAGELSRKMRGDLGEPLPRQDGHIGDKLIAVDDSMVPPTGEEYWKRRCLRAEEVVGVHRLDCGKFREFYNKHALGPKAQPSCLVCGRSMHGRTVGIQHMELPGVVVCIECRDNAARGAENYEGIK